jgi:hypothetical protein
MNASPPANGERPTLSGMEANGDVYVGSTLYATAGRWSGVPAPTYSYLWRYEVPAARVAELMRAAVALPSIRVTDEPSLVRAREVYELERLDFAEAYLVAQAEATGVGAIASFDRSIDRVANISRREP